MPLRPSFGPFYGPVNGNPGSYYNPRLPFSQPQPLNSYLAPPLLPTPQMLLQQQHNQKPPSLRQPQPPPQAYLASPTSTSSQEWFPDSGAKHHVTRDIANLLEQVAITESTPSQVYMGNGQ